ncbi:MAG: HEAT repeat domain-containing protein [Bryobacterales bacterium]|nr:HEAT repeat domain-containing protein [Bryobacterales bacterium]
MRTNWNLIGFFLAGLAAPALWGQAPARPPVRELIGVLGQSGAGLHARARACQQLGEYGTREAVPALAALLTDPALSAYARSGLEGIPDPSAAAALRAALGRLKGDLLIGVVNSLGVLRDEKAAPALGKLAENPASGASHAALLALGRISNGESIRILRRALASGPEELRPGAAAACLLAAEFQVRQNAGNAAALYDTVRASAVPMPYRMAATRGAIVARGPGGVDLLVKLLRSDEREIRNVALYTVRGLSGASLSAALRGELETARPEVQAQLLVALADCCRDAGTIRAIRAKVSAERPEVRAAAFQALGKIGDPADAAALLEGVVSRRSAEESAAAAGSLARIPGSGTDSLVLRRLASTADPESRAALIDVIDARPPSQHAAGELLKQAGDPDLRVSMAALRTLRSLAGVSHLPALMAVTRTCKDGNQRAAAESALQYACTRSKDTTRAGELLLAGLKQEGEDLDKASWIRTLASIGYAPALPTIMQSLRSPNSWLVRTTLDSLGRWPDPAPAGELLGIAESTPDAATRTRALTSAVRLAAAAAEGRQAPDETVAGWFRRAGAAARSPEEKRLIVAGLGRWRSTAGFRLLAAYLDDPEVKAEAANAAVSVGQTLAEGSDYLAVKPVLERLPATTDQALSDRIERLRKTVAAAEAGRR